MESGVCTINDSGDNDSGGSGTDGSSYAAGSASLHCTALTRSVLTYLNWKTVMVAQRRLRSDFDSSQSDQCSLNA